MGNSSWPLLICLTGLLIWGRGGLGTPAVSPCRPHLVAGQHDGFVCPLTESGISSIPTNTGALRLASVHSARHQRLNLTLPELMELVILELDVTRALDLSHTPFVQLPSLQRLQLHHSAAGHFRFVPDVGLFDGIPDLRHLILPDLGIEELPVGLFRDLGNLRTLELNHNRLTRLERGTFSECCRMLSFLTLARNRIEDLTLVSWNGLSGLRNLDLSGNRLSTLPAGGFDGLENLTSVDLTRNRIHSIHPGAFAGSGRLRELFLNHNQLRVQSKPQHEGSSLGLRRSSFEGLMSLETLELSQNLIECGVPEVFLELRALKRLDLSENRIQFLTANDFRDLSNLTELKLQGNRLTTLDRSFREVFNRILTFDLSSNPWNCDCRILWMAEWMAEYAAGRTTDLEDITVDDTECAEPIAGQKLTLVFQNTECVQETTVQPSRATQPATTSVTDPFHDNPSTESTTAMVTSDLVTTTTKTTESGSGETLLSSITADVRSFTDLITTEIVEMERLKTLETLIESVTKNLKSLDSLLLTTVSKIDALNRLLTATITTIETSDPNAEQNSEAEQDSKAEPNSDVVLVGSEKYPAPDNLRNNAPTKLRTTIAGFLCLTLLFKIFEVLR